MLPPWKRNAGYRRERRRDDPEQFPDGWRLDQCCFRQRKRLPTTAATPGLRIANPDAIQEFKIQTSLFDAGYGRNPGANVNVVTKSGTNQFHGTAFEFFRNTALNANDFFRKISPRRSTAFPITDDRC